MLSEVNLDFVRANNVDAVSWSRRVRSQETPSCSSDRGLNVTR